MDVVGCVGVTFLVVVWVVFGFWFGFLVAFGSGLSGVVSLVCMALCCFLRVVSVSACWVCFGFSLVFWGGFFAVGYGVCCFRGWRFLLLRFLGSVFSG